MNKTENLKNNKNQINNVWRKKRSNKKKKTDQRKKNLKN